MYNSSIVSYIKEEEIQMLLQSLLSISYSITKQYGVMPSCWLAINSHNDRNEPTAVEGWDD